MDIIHFIADTITAALKHGWSLTTFILVIVALFRIQIIQNMLLRRLPRRFRHKDRLEIVEMKIDVIAAHMGVEEWDVDSKIGKNAQHVISGQQKRSSSPLAAFVPVTRAKFFTRSKETYHLSQRRMSMKSKLLSRKLWMTILGSVVLVLNQQLGLELNADSIIGIGSLIMSFILGQSVVDMNGLGQFAPLIEKLKSSKLWVSLLGSIFIVLNDHLQWGMTPENIYVIVGIAVSFILGKSGVSYVQASNKDASHYR